MIANWPGVIKPGQVVDDLVDMSDYWATFMDLTDTKKTRGREVDGISFAPRLLGTGDSARAWAYSGETGRFKPDGSNSGRKWVRTARWKLYNDGSLFDLQNDPQEQQALVYSKAAPAEQQAARTDLLQAFRQLGLE